MNQAWRTHKIEGVAITAAMSTEGQCVPAFGRTSRQICPYVFLDICYEKVRPDGQIRDAAILIAMGVGLDGKRQILGVSVSLSEHEIHWRTFLQSLVARGLKRVRASPAMTMPV